MAGPITPDGVVDFGEHRGMGILDVYDMRPSYITWACGHVAGMREDTIKHLYEAMLARDLALNRHGKTDDEIRNDLDRRWDALVESGTFPYFDPEKSQSTRQHREQLARLSERGSRVPPSTRASPVPKPPPQPPPPSTKGYAVKALSSRRAIDEASLQFLDEWLATRREAEGIAAWVDRMAQAAYSSAVTDHQGNLLWGNMIFYTKEQGDKLIIERLGKVAGISSKPTQEALRPASTAEAYW